MAPRWRRAAVPPRAPSTVAPPMLPRLCVAPGPPVQKDNRWKEIWKREQVLVLGFLFLGSCLCPPNGGWVGSPFGGWVVSPCWGVPHPEGGCRPPFRGCPPKGGRVNDGSGTATAGRVVAHGSASRGRPASATPRKHRPVSWRPPAPGSRQKPSSRVGCRGRGDGPGGRSAGVPCRRGHWRHRGAGMGPAPNRQLRGRRPSAGPARNLGLLLGALEAPPGPLDLPSLVLHELGQQPAHERGDTTASGVGAQPGGLFGAEEQDDGGAGLRGQGEGHNHGWTVEWRDASELE
jgi:hypothetical protein